MRVEQVEMLAKSLRPLPFGKEETVDGQVVRHSGFADPRAAVSPALRRPRRAPGGARALHRALADDPRRSAAFLDGLRLPRGGDAGAAAAVRRRRRREPFMTHHNALDMPLYPAHRRRAVPQAARRGRASTACTRSGTTSATRASTGRTIRSSRCSSSTRRMPTTPSMMDAVEALWSRRDAVRACARQLPSERRSGATGCRCCRRRSRASSGCPSLNAASGRATPCRRPMTRAARDAAAPSGVEQRGER